MVRPSAVLNKRGTLRRNISALIAAVPVDDEFSGAEVMNWLRALLEHDTERNKRKRRDRKPHSWAPAVRVRSGTYSFKRTDIAEHWDRAPAAFRISGPDLYTFTLRPEFVNNARRVVDQTAGRAAY